MASKKLDIPHQETEVRINRMVCRHQLDTNRQDRQVISSFINNWLGLPSGTYDIIVQRSSKIHDHGIHLAPSLGSKTIIRFELVFTCCHKIWLIHRINAKHHGYASCKGPATWLGKGQIMLDCTCPYITTRWACLHIHKATCPYILVIIGGDDDRGLHHPIQDHSLRVLTWCPMDGWRCYNLRRPTASFVLLSISAIVYYKSFITFLRSLCIQ